MGMRRAAAPRRLLDASRRRAVGPSRDGLPSHAPAPARPARTHTEVTALRELFTELLGDMHAVAHIANLMAGADIHCGMGVADAARRPLGPDLVLGTSHGALRLAEGAARTARPLGLDLTEDACFASRSGWMAGVGVDAVTGSTRDSHACALLLRPDCYVASATDTARPDRALRD